MPDPNGRRPTPLQLERADIIVNYLAFWAGPEPLDKPLPQGWGLYSRESVEHTAAKLNPRILAAFAGAITDPATEQDLLGVAAKFTLDWLRDSSAGNPIADAHAREAQRRVGDMLPFFDLITLVRRAHPGSLPGARHYVGAAREALISEGLLERAGLHLKVPGAGAVALPVPQRAAARAYVLGWLLMHTGCVDAGRLDPDLMALLLQHEARPAQLVAVAARRRTLDPEVINEVLRSPTPVLAEGAL